MRNITENEAKNFGNYLRQEFAKVGLSSQSRIEIVTGVDQTQISKIFNGNFRRVSSNLKILCKYANCDYSKLSEFGVHEMEEPPDRDRVLKAFDTVWDGTKEHADVIAHLILVTGRFTKRLHSGEKSIKRGE
ncbi:helix-turn-helix transcriptional regulator [Undibacterium amnicola]|uniref:Helix-turn-helix transcriptional regulator n=1 Tax=Undibacterium amnicola TaxID=1834038 RepID=A0ABR6XTU4_9BURK|nr:helix-turn-helix transcriptional regulator [Undibacterium amnicola]MBC3832419.1 helix-turn-helix transcriptional regulator [Undibacterium amnicola]